MFKTGMPSDLNVPYPDDLGHYQALSQKLSFDLAGAIAGERVNTGILVNDKSGLIVDECKPVFVRDVQ